MIELPDDISEELDRYFSPVLDEHSQDFLCVYGSSLYKGPEASSDVDMFLVTHTSLDLDLKNIASFIRDLHIRYGRKIDEEVPYENKIHYSHEEIDDALGLGAFEARSDGIFVPKVEKTPTFLNSPEIKARLALNALTTPHTAKAPDRTQYFKTKERAEEAVVALAIGLCNNPEVELEELYARLTVGPDGETGEMHLGYKVEHPTVENYLREVLEAGATRLISRGVIGATSSGVRVAPDFNPFQLKYAKLPTM